MIRNVVDQIGYALRRLRRSPGFALTAVLTLALGIGATTAIFTLVYQVVLRSLPVAHPEQLYRLGDNLDCCATGGVQQPWTLFSYDLYRTLQAEAPGADSMAAVSAAQFPVSVRQPGPGDTTAQTLTLEFVSGNYFQVLGVPSYAGRTLTPADDREGAAPVVVLSYRLWQTRFAADPSLVGATLLFGGHPVTVVGIAAPSFLSERNVSSPAGIWLPLHQEPGFHPDQPDMRLPGVHWLRLLLRIPNPRNVPTVRAALTASLQRWLLAHRDLTQNATDDRIHRAILDVVASHDGLNSLRGQYEGDLRLLLLVAGLVLLIACANLANLMLVRGMAGSAEGALRSALGASRLRLLWQSPTESLVLAVLGGLAALAVAFLGTRAILALAFGDADTVPLYARPSLPVLVFALALSLVTGVLFGTLPAWLSSRRSPLDALRGGSRTQSKASTLPQRLLVVLQAALSLALLSVAALLLTSLERLERQNFHFEPHGRLLLTTNLTAAGYAAGQLPAFYRQLDATLERVPMVQRFAYATYGPMTNSNWGTGVWFPGGADDAHLAWYLAASAHFFDTLGTPVVLGRGFTDADTATSPHVAIVNRAFVEQFLPGQQPLGQRFGPSPSLRDEFVIVGVVENSKYGPATDPGTPMFFKPITQTTLYPDAQSRSVEGSLHAMSNLIVAYRGASDTAERQVRAALHSLNPDIPILESVTYDETLADNFTQQRLVVRLTSFFGLLALALASLGLYGVTAYAVEQRTGEIGVRMALGADRANVLRLILRSALSQTALGLALGVPLSLLAGHLLRHALFGATTAQPLLLLAVLLLLLVAATLAAWLPARRASRVEPVEALRAS